ncbi:MAG TPA: hypothetical protein VM840_04680, partial [Actinomycetota bacterium]|nr:hypothetical protein [Actinomycetota bacterium]
MRSPRLMHLVVALAVLLPALPAGAQTQLLEQLPVTHAQTPRGVGIVTPAAPVAPTAKVVDGDISDWTGTGAGYGGTVVHSHGELIYTDHLFDSYGADDGRDARRYRELYGPLRSVAPETYRAEGIFQALAGELGLPVPHDYQAEEHYGNQGFQPAADLLELRVAADADNLYVLARTTTMTDPDDAAVVLLADTRPSPGERGVPFSTGLTTSEGDVAVFLGSHEPRLVDLETGATSPISVAIEPDGYTNSFEAAIPRASLAGSHLRLAAATGLHDGVGAFAIR